MKLEAELLNTNPRLLEASLLEASGRHTFGSKERSRSACRSPEEASGVMFEPRYIHSSSRVAARLLSSIPRVAKVTEQTSTAEQEEWPCRFMIAASWHIRRVFHYISHSKLSLPS